MKKININRHNTFVFLLSILGIALVGVLIYTLFELRGLRARVHTVEYSRGEELSQLGQQNESFESEKVDLQILSKSSAVVQVEDMDANIQLQPYQDLVYKPQKVQVYKVKITNNTSVPYDYSDVDIRGKTEAGTLVNSISFLSVHPSDRKGNDTLGLAPGGSGTVTIYFPADEEIISLYSTSNV